MDIIKSIEQEQLKDNLPEFRVGDTIQVHYKIIEGARERIQVFEGTVIKRQGGGINESFTVRRLSYGVGVERTFPLHSPESSRCYEEITTFIVHIGGYLIRRFLDSQ